MYLHRIHTVTFLSFRAYNTDNQLITDTNVVIIFHLKLSLTSFNVLAKKSLIYGYYRIQYRKHKSTLKQYQDAVIADATNHTTDNSTVEA